MALLIPALGALAPAASARPAKAVVRPAAKSHTVAAAHATRTKAAARPAAAKAHATLRAQAETPVRGRSRKAVAVPAEARSHAGSRGHALVKAREEMKPHGRASLHPEMKTPAHPAAPAAKGEPKPLVVAATPVANVASRPAPEPAAAQPDEPTVKHDRKHHLPAEAVPGTPSAPDSGKPGQTAAASADTAGTEATAALFTKGGRLIMPPAMKGSHEILVHQNVMADQDGLERVQDDDDLNRMRAARVLLPLPESPALVADDRLPANRRFARPWTVKFLEALAKAHYERFHSPLQVNSAVRTVEFQRNLMRVNGNAAPAEGETASPHLTGQAVDLAKKGLSLTEIAWLRGYLLPLVQGGKIDVEEEFQQSCFHISVYRRYVPEAAPRREIVNRPLAGSAIAAAMR